MKKTFFILFLSLVVLFSAFSANTSLGVAMNYVDTSFIADVEFGRFGFEGSLGFPVLSGVLGTLDSVSNGEDFQFVKFLLPGAMINPYFKAVDGSKFQLRLGLQTDILAFVDKESIQVAGLFGTAIGLNYKFSEKFGINFTAGLPLALPLSLISNEAASWTLFYLSSKDIDKEDIAKIILGGVGCAMNQFARISCKWSLN